MPRCLILLALLALGATSPAKPLHWPLQKYRQWQPAWGSRTIAAAGLNVHVAVERCGEDRPASESCADRTTYLVATVSAPGMGSVVVQGQPGVAAYVGIGKLTRSATRPSLILISENGGSAGCVEIDLAVPRGGAYRSVRLTVDKNDHGTLCQVDPTGLEWPRDLTGHGRPEFLMLDAAFHCRFTSCASSWYPPRIIAFDGRRGIDLSTNPALAPLYRKDLAKARYACEHDTEEAQGACAGYAADASRLGFLSEAWRVIDAQVRRGCRVPRSNGCADINIIPATFPAKLATFLPEAGYR